MIIYTYTVQKFYGLGEILSVSGKMGLVLSSIIKNPVNTQI